MDHIRTMLPTLAEHPRRSSKSRNAIPWRAAADEAYRVACQRVEQPASRRQLERVCQLLSSGVLEQRERRRAFLRLSEGCTRRQASAMLDYLIPVVRSRMAKRATGEMTRSPALAAASHRPPHPSIDPVRPREMRPR